MRLRPEAAPAASAYAREYAPYVASLVASVDAAAIDRLVSEIERAREQGRTIFFAGNGGSAATAAHWACDLGLGVASPSGAPYRCISLTDSGPTFSALGNDRGYEETFARQVATLGLEGDVLVAISASGNSPNVLRAVEEARRRGIMTVGVTGFDGGLLRGACDVSVHVESLHGEYGAVEDAHLMLNHLIADFLRERDRAASRDGG